MYSKQVVVAVLRFCLSMAAALMLLAGAASRAHAQHAGHDTTKKATATMDTMPMTMAGPLGISMERMGSGTTWIPDAVILPSRHFMVGKWMLMLHGFVFAQYDEQGGPRGASQFGSLNWAMIMADRELGGGRLQLRFMPSLDPATVGKCGYPLLLQSGEKCNGQPIVDRQHPHDLFMEVGALYERPIASNLAMLLYAAPAGEPALGPVAFMHRPSAMDEPQAPLGHHWQDATHISFGVVTAGLFTRKIRLEASAFNGHEPNEERWDFDAIGLNSYSGRLTVNPNENWSLTAGYGKLDNPELSSPPEDLRRFVASAMYGRKLGTEGQWASTVIYGHNTHAGEAASHSALAESEAVIGKRNTVFGRAEYVQKSARDLQLTAFPDEQLFGVSSLSLGYIRDFARGRGITIGLGARGTVNFVPNDLETSYGSRTPVGGMVFLRVRPYHSQAHTVDGMGGTPHHGSGHESSDSTEVIGVVGRYRAALAAGDSTTALSLLSMDAVILESGGVETREQYRAHHLPADIAFARAVPSERSDIRAIVRGDVAWVSSASTTRGEFRGRQINSRGAELMVLSRESDGWKIRAIHWSSRNRSP